jgi:hypothetical protein
METIHFIPDDGRGVAVCAACRDLTAAPVSGHVGERRCLTLCERCAEARRLADWTGRPYEPGQWRERAAG